MIEKIKIALKQNSRFQATIFSDNSLKYVQYNDLSYFSFLHYCLEKEYIFRNPRNEVQTVIDSQKRNLTYYWNEIISKSISINALRDSKVERCIEHICKTDKLMNKENLNAVKIRFGKRSFFIQNSGGLL